MKKIILTLILFSFIFGCAQPQTNNEQNLEDTTPNITTPLNPEIIPNDCISWFDGCATCVLVDGEITACTKTACKEYGEAECLEYAQIEPETAVVPDINQNNLDNEIDPVDPSLDPEFNDGIFPPGFEENGGEIPPAE